MRSAAVPATALAASTAASWHASSRVAALAPHAEHELGDAASPSASIPYQSSSGASVSQLVLSTQFGPSVAW